MFHHKRYSVRQRLVMRAREVSARLHAMAACHFQCPGCGSSNTSGSYPGSWICHNCGAQGQS